MAVGPEWVTWPLSELEVDTGDDREEERDVQAGDRGLPSEVRAGKDDRNQTAWCLVGAPQLIFLLPVL